MIKEAAAGMDVQSMSTGQPAAGVVLVGRRVGLMDIGFNGFVNVMELAAGRVAAQVTRVST